MFQSRRSFSLGLVAFALSACAPKFKVYNGPEITSVVLKKGERRLYLLHGKQTLHVYDVDLGNAPEGSKQIEGDSKTPEGLYYINRRNPKSRYHLSLGISYPNARDVARAAAMGRSPGGNIFIHGTPRRYLDVADWTAGCIAVPNYQMEDIYAMVRDGTPILITP